MDLVIHPREHDLVIGTFGRSAYVIDDIRPLRALARDFEGVKSSRIFPVEPPEAYLAERGNAPGYYFTGDAYFEGENRQRGGRISYFAKVDKEEGDSKSEKDSVTIEVLDVDMKLQRTLKQLPENGLNRTTWYLDRKGVRLSFSAKEPKSGGDEPGGGGYVLPGTYNLRMSYQGDTASTRIEVKPDPRIPYDALAMKNNQEIADQLMAKMEALHGGLSKIRKCREGALLVNKLSGKDQSEELKSATASMEAALSKLEQKLFRDEDIQGIYYPSDALYVQLSRGLRLQSIRPFTDNQLDKQARFHSLADEAIQWINDFMEDEWAAYRAAVVREQISILGE
jgi:hypothetical protein